MTVETYSQLEQSIEIQSLQCQLSLEDVYEKIELELGDIPSINGNIRAE